MTPVTPPPLLSIDVALPDWPVVGRARRRLDVVRSCIGRVATLAGAAAAAAGLFTADVTGVSVLATATLSAAGLVSLRLWEPDSLQRATATVLYLMPGAGLAVLLVAERVVAGIHWGEALALAVWTTATWVLRPARVARRMLSPLPAPAPVPAPEVVVDGHPVARWWAHRVAAEGGAAPGTLLEGIERTGQTSMRAVIRSAVPGQPVPEVSVKHLSALMDIPQEDIHITGLPGRGAGVRRLTIGTPDDSEDATTVWARRIAPVAMPGAVLTSVRIGRPGTTPAPTATATVLPGGEA